MKVCLKCNGLNDDDAYYCKYCGAELINVYRGDDSFSSFQISNHSILVGYLLSVIFGWLGVILILLANITNSMFFIGFFGFILPINLIKSSDWKVKKHGYIQSFICLIGIIVQLLLMFHILK